MRDVEFVAAFDVDAKKVGFDLSDAIFASENNTIKIADVPPTGVTVQRAHPRRHPAKYYRQTITEADGEGVDVVQALGDAQVDVWSATCPSVPIRPTSSTLSAASTPASPSSTHCRSSSPPTREWAKKFRDAGVRSSATTSRARWAPPSPTA